MADAGRQRQREYDQQANKTNDEHLNGALSRRSPPLQTFPNGQPYSTTVGSGQMRRILLLVTCLAATPCIAADAGIPLRSMPPFRRSEKTCLSVYYNGTAAYWLNHCAHSVSVRWDDEAKCQNWSCLDEVPANTRSTAPISGHVRWCECPGTLSTCNIPTTGC